MSRNKSWDEQEENRKVARSIYMSSKEWDWLRKEGKGSPTKIIREMINERQLQAQDLKSSA